MPTSAKSDVRLGGLDIRKAIIHAIKRVFYCKNSHQIMGCSFNQHPLKIKIMVGLMETSQDVLFTYETVRQLC